MPAPTDRQVADWLVALGPLVAAKMTPEEAHSRLRAYVPELVARFDSADFNGGTREFVARHCKFFPAYGELCELLGRASEEAAARRRTQERAALPAPASDAAEMDANDRMWLAFWHKRRAEIWAQLPPYKHGSRDGEMANLLSLVRRESPKAWQTITGKREQTISPTEHDIAAVAAKLEAWRAQPGRGRALPPEPAPRPKARHLDDDTLEEVRAARANRA